MDIKAAMKRSELFRGLDDEQLGQIAAISHKKTFNSNETIFEKGDQGDGFYIVGSGQVSVQQTDEEGTAYPTIYLGKGQSFGEMALIDATTRSASIVAANDDTELYYLTTEDFINLCKTNTAIGYIMMRNIAQDLSFKLRHNVMSNM